MEKSKQWVQKSPDKSQVRSATTKDKGNTLVIEKTEILKPIKAKGGKWIQKAIKHPGALHQELHVPQGQKIPTAKLKRAMYSSNPIEKKRANLAMTLRKISHRNG